MSGFENYARETREIELEIERKGVILGIDWSNQAQVRDLAREAIAHAADDVRIAESHPSDYVALAKAELFGLAHLMLQTMKESAIDNVESHGGEAWKAFARALYTETLDKRPRDA